MKGLITVIFFLFYTSLFSQITDSTFFSDTITGQMSHMYNSIEVEDGVIISGYTSDHDIIHPYICKIDKSGDLVWTTLDSIQLNVQYAALSGSFNIELFEDGFVYGRSDYVFGNSDTYIWKVNATTGKVGFFKKFYQPINQKVSIADYDSSKFLMTYHEDIFPNNVKLAYMNKANGDTLSTHFISPLAVNNAWDLHGAVVDASKNIYFWQIDQLIKLNKGNPDEVLWKRTFTDSTIDMTKIEDCHIDEFDNLYLFGTSPFGNGQSLVIRVDQNSGKQIWNTPLVFDYFKSDLVDKYGKLYLTYDKCCFGGTYSYYAAKLDKENGHIDWSGFQNISLPLGTTGVQANTLGVDVDCLGDVYITGSNSQTSVSNNQAGLIKLDGNSGVKIYDEVIFEENSITAGYITGYSIGKSAHVFGNSPLIIGEMESDTTGGIQNNYDVYFTHTASIDPSNGNTIVNKPIGGDNNLKSKTLDIIKSGDSLFVFKQLGKYIQIDLFDSQDNLLWSELIYDSTYIQGGQMAVSPSYVYITSKTNAGYDTLPYDNGLAEQLKLYRLSKQTGSIIDFDTLAIPNVSVELLELEANDVSGFIFYKQGVFNLTAQWNPGTGVSMISTSNYSSSPDFMGQTNNVVDFNPLTLLVIGNATIATRDKASFSSGVLFTFPSTRLYNDHIQVGDTLLLAGENASGDKLLTAFSLTTNLILWEQTFGQGALYKISNIGSTTVMIAGNQDSLVYTAMVNLSGVSSLWENYSNVNQYSEIELMDADINPINKSIIVTGEARVSQQISDLFIAELDYNGDTLGYYLGVDQIDKKSGGFVIEIGPDSNTYVGGAYNHDSALREGFIFKMANANCPRDISLQYDVCLDTAATLTAWVGTSYQWYHNGVQILSANNQTLLITQPGLYNCIVNDSCSLDSLYSGVAIGPNFFDQLNVLISLQDSIICYDSGLNSLTGSPIGGVFSGPGVTGSDFDPQAVGLGQYQLYYNYTDSNGCSGYDSVLIQVVDSSSSIINLMAVDSVTVNSTTYYASGAYTQNLINANGCDSLLTINVNMSFNDLAENELNYKIFPNPTSSVFNIEGASIIGLNIKLFDMTGKLVTEKTHKSFHTEINVAPFDRGTYLLQIGSSRELIVVN